MEFDLHIHSSFSFDGADTPEEIVEQAIKVGLRGIAIADHDSAGAVKIAEHCAGERLLVVPAIELSTKFGDVLAYFFAEPLELEIDDKFEELREISKRIRDKGGLVCLPHPKRGQLAEIEDVGCAKLFDLVEGFNSRRHAVANVLEFGGEPYIIDFAKRHSLGMTAGSDSHSLSTIGTGRTIMPADSLEDVKRALVKGNTVLTGKKTGWVSGLFDKFMKGPDKENEK